MGGGGNGSRVKNQKDETNALCTSDNEPSEMAVGGRGHFTVWFDQTK